MNRKWVDRCKKEATQNVLFLVQERQLIPIGAPIGYRLSENSNSFIADYNQSSLSLLDAYNRHMETSIGSIAVIDVYIPLRVFIEREEAEDWIKSQRSTYGFKITAISGHGLIVDVVNRLNV